MIMMMISLLIRRAIAGAMTNLVLESGGAVM